MISVDLPERKEEDKPTTTAPECPQERWPYGLRITFEKDQVDKIPSLSEYRVGDRVLITAEACVTEIRMSERKDGEDDHTVGMQIEKVSCELAVEKKPEEMSMREYRLHRHSEHSGY